MAKLFAMSSDLIKHNIHIILIQIDEAHSTAWPLSIDTILKVDQPEPQKTFEDRLSRANYFVNNYQPPYDIYIDGWDNQFAEIFRAWPDKYHLIDQNMMIIAKSEYGMEGEKEAVILEDCTILLEKIMNKN